MSDEEEQTQEEGRDFRAAAATAVTAAGGTLPPGYDAALRLSRGSCAGPCEALKTVTFPASAGGQQELQLAPGLATCSSSTCDFGEPGCSCSVTYSLMGGSTNSTWDFQLEEGTSVLLGDSIEFTVTSGGPAGPPGTPQSEPPPPNSPPVAPTTSGACTTNGAG